MVQSKQSWKCWHSCIVERSRKNVTTELNKNAFQWDAYRQLVDCIPERTVHGVSAQGVSARGVYAQGVVCPRVGVCLGVSAQGGICLGVYPSIQWGRPPRPPWTERCLWKHNLRKLRFRAVTMSAHCAEITFAIPFQFLFRIKQKEIAICPQWARSNFDARPWG